jgi:hypothetical protein
VDSFWAVVETKRATAIAADYRSEIIRQQNLNGVVKALRSQMHEEASLITKRLGYNKIIRG